MIVRLLRQCGQSVATEDSTHPVHHQFYSPQHRQCLHERHETTTRSARRSMAERHRAAPSAESSFPSGAEKNHQERAEITTTKYWRGDLTAQCSLEETEVLGRKQRAWARERAKRDWRSLRERRGRARRSGSAGSGFSLDKDGVAQGGVARDAPLETTSFRSSSRRVACWFATCTRSGDK